MKKHIVKIFVFVLTIGFILFSFQSANLEAAGEMTMEEAKEKVLDLVNLKEKEVTFTKEKKEVENGVEVYVIEFVNKKKTAEYEFEIEVETGDVLEASYEKISWKKKKKSQSEETSVKETKTESAANNLLTEDQALAIALQDAGYDEQAIAYKSISLFTTNSGQKVYDIDFMVGAGDLEFDYQVDAATGEILSKDIDDNTDDVYDTEDEPSDLDD